MEGSFFCRRIHGDANLESPAVLAAVGVEAHQVLLAGVYLVIGGSPLRLSLQRGIVLRHKDGALGGVGGVHLGLVAIDPGGGGGRHIHHPGVILLAVDGFLFDAVFSVYNRTGKTIFIDDFHAPEIPVRLSPEVQPGIEVLVPLGGVPQNTLDAVEDADLLSIRGGLHHRGAARRKGGAGDRDLPAGGPHRHLGGVLVLGFGKAGDAPHIVLVELLELLQRPGGVAVGEGPHGLGAAVVRLDGEGLVGGHSGEAPIDTVCGTREAVVAGILPVAAADGAAGFLAQVIAESVLGNLHTAAVVQRVGCAGWDGQQANQRGNHQQHGD